VEKNGVLNQSLTHSPSLFDAPGTEAFTSEQATIYRFINMTLNHAIQHITSTALASQTVHELYK